MHNYTLLFLFVWQIEDGEIFKYRVKIINPKAKKESIVIDWCTIKEKFVTVANLKEKLVNSLGAHLSDEFNIGYFHGRQQVGFDLKMTFKLYWEQGDSFVV